MPISDDQATLKFKIDGSQAERFVARMENQISKLNKGVKIKVDFDLDERKTNALFNKLTSKFKSYKLNLDVDFKGSSKLKQIDASIKSVQKTAANKTEVDIDTSKSVGKAKELKKVIDEVKEKDKIPFSTSFNKDELSTVIREFKEFKKTTDTPIRASFGIKKNPGEDISDVIRELDKLKKGSKDTIRFRVNVQQNSNSFNRLNRNIKELNKPIRIRALVSNLASRELGTIQRRLGDIRSLSAASFVLRFSEFGLAGISNALNSIISRVSSVFGFTARRESQQVSLTNTLFNRSVRQFEAGRSFQSGTGSVNDFAALKGVNLDSLQAKPSSGGGGGGGGSSAASSALSASLNELESQKKRLESVANTEIRQREIEIKQLGETVQLIENQKQARLESLGVDEDTIDNLERSNRLRKQSLDLQVKEAGQRFDKQNDPEKLKLLKEETDLTILIARLKKDGIQGGERGEIRRSERQLSIIKERVQAFDSEKEALQDQVRISQNFAREQIEDTENVLTAKKSAAEEESVAFDNRIDRQKSAIEELEQFIDQTRLQLDIDTSPLEDAIDRARTQISQFSGGGGGGGSFGGGGVSGLVTKPEVQAEIDRLNQLRQETRFKDKSDSEIFQILEKEARQRAKEIESKGVDFAAKTPLGTETINSLLVGLENSGFDTLAGTENGGSILNAGGQNAVNSATDLITRLKLQFGITEEQAIESLNIGLAEASGGDFTSLIRRFNVSRGQIDTALSEAGIEDFASADADQKTAFLNSFAQVTGSAGLAEASGGTAEGLGSTIKDNLTLLESKVFGDIDDPNSLFSRFKNLQSRIINFFEGEGGDRLAERLEKIGFRFAEFIDTALTEQNIDRFGTFLENVAEWGLKVFTLENAEKVLRFISGVTNFVFGDEDTESKGGRVLGGGAAGLGGLLSVPIFGAIGKSAGGKVLANLLGEGGEAAGKGLLGKFLGTSVGKSVGAGAIGGPIGILSGLISAGIDIPLSGLIGGRLGSEAGLGSGIGGTIGGVVGGVAGTAFGGPVGTVAGSAVGTAAGNVIGGGVGALFNKDNREKVQEFAGNNKGKILGAALGGPLLGLSLGSLIDENSREKLIGFFNKKFPDAVEKLKERFSELKERIEKGLSNAVEVVSNKKDEIVESVSNFFGNTIPSFIDDTAQRFSEFASNIRDSVSDFIFGDWEQRFFDLGVSAGEFAAQIINKFIDMGERTVGVLVDIGERIGNFFTTTLPEFVTNSINTIIEKKNQLKEIFTVFFTQTIPETISFLRDSAIERFVSIKDFVKKTVTQDIPIFFNELPGKVKNTVEKMITQAQQKIPELLQQFKNLVSDVQSELSKIPGKIASAITDAGTTVKENAGSFLSGFKQGFNNERATGGPVLRGRNYIVNEEGQELFSSGGRLELISGGQQNFTPPEDGFIIPADITKQILSNLQVSNPSNQINNTFNLNQPGEQLKKDFVKSEYFSILNSLAPT